MTFDPSKYNLRLKIPEGQRVELAFFKALLAYVNGVPVVVMTSKRVLHGGETLELIVAGSAALTVWYVDLGSRFPGRDEAIAEAFNAEECDWLEFLQAARINFMNGSPLNERYVAWIQSEIGRRRQAGAR